MSKIIRGILTLALIYGSYKEAGIFTSLSLLLIFISIEVTGLMMGKIVDRVNGK